jgi:PilZ domain-containing protein
MGERRTQPRITACDLVLVGWHDGIGKLSQLGNVEDLSLGGMGILVHDDLPVGTPVTVTYGYGELGGIIRHSSARNPGVFIGIEFDEFSKNSMLHFQPELLIREL